MTTADPRPKAYSYLRFSTPEQEQGDSFRRQWKAALDYAERHNLNLDQQLVFHDRGIAAFRGANAERGKLAAFRRAVEDGDVAKGSYLLVEDFDRLSRMDPWDALPIFQDIVNHGINLVTLKDGRVWNKQELRGNPLRLIEPLLAMWNGHNESVKKSIRLSEVHDAKRKRIVEGEKLDKPYKHGPGWVRWNDSKKRFELIPERAAVVKDVFARADEGWSLDRIARRLNETHIATWERGKNKAEFWRGARLRKMLLNHAAIGALVMHKTEHDPDTHKRSDTVVGTKEGYYPTVVERDVFERVKARLATKAPRGRNALRPITSIVAGVARCVHCGDSMIRVSKGHYVYVVCARAHMKAGCKYQAVHYQEVENALRDNANALVDEAPRGQATESIQRQIETLDWQLSDMKDAAKNLLRELRLTGSRTAREELKEAESNIKASEDKLRELQDRRERLGLPFVTRRLDTLREELTRKDFDVVAANRAIKATVDKIIIDPEGCRLDVCWRDGDIVSEVMFWSKHSTIFPDIVEDVTGANAKLGARQ
jgi:DNA invertase Pin-like site-specific DNA recombinase